MERRLLTIKEASEYLSIAEGTLYNWVSQKKIKVVKLNRSVRFDIRYLEELIKTNTVSEYVRSQSV